MAITLTTMTTEATDKKFTVVSGDTFRAKICIPSATFANLPNAADADTAAATLFTVELSISAINDDESVKTTPDGRFVIFDAHEVVVSYDQMRSPNFDLSAVIANELERMGDDASVILGTMTTTLDYLRTEWGVSPDAMLPKLVVPVATNPVPIADTSSIDRPADGETATD